MPRGVQQLKIFLASPGDVDSERARVEKIARELNRSLLLDAAIQLEVVAWETHAYPGFGQDPQSLINNQIGTDYDIFIGILWSRVGTPTPRFPSGTLEEFQVAYERWKVDQTSVSLMIYFKDEPVCPSQLDTGQLSQIQNFKEQLSPAGGLYWTFKTTDEFETNFRLHLTRVVQDWCDRLKSSPELNSTQPANSEPVSTAAQIDETDDFELGILDYMELSTEAAARHGAVLMRITCAIQLIGKESAERTREAHAATLQPAIGTARSIFDRSAQNLNDFSASLLGETPQLLQAHADLLKYHVGGASLSLEFGEPGKVQVQQLPGQLGSLTDAMRTSRSLTHEFRDTLAAMPRVTATFNKAKRRALDALDALDIVMDELVKKNMQVEAEVRDLLQRAEASKPFSKRQLEVDGTPLLGS